MSGADAVHGRNESEDTEDIERPREWKQGQNASEQRTEEGSPVEGSVPIDEDQSSPTSQEEGRGGARRSDENKRSREAILHLISFGVMILALWAFGLHQEPTETASGGHQDATKDANVTRLVPNWKEIPAILLVFLLVEIGLHLGTDAKEAAEEAAAAHAGVKDTHEKATKTLLGLEKKLTAESTNLDGLLRRLGRLNNAANYLEELTETAGPITRCCDAAESDVVSYAKAFLSWWKFDEKVSENGDRRRLAKTLLDTLAVDVGSAEAGGGPDARPVREREGGFSFVSTDTVYCVLSKEWLKALDRNGAGVSDGRLPRIEVLAVSALNPAAFAIPELYFDDGPPGRSSPTRASQLRLFTDSILEIRKDLGERLRYRRIIVSDPNQKGLQGIGHFGSRDWRAMHNWWVWDPKLQNESVSTSVHAEKDFFLKKFSEKVVRNTDLYAYFGPRKGGGVGRARSTLVEEVKSDGVIVDVIPRSIQVPGSEKLLAVLGYGDGVDSEIEALLDDRKWRRLSDYFIEDLHKGTGEQEPARIITNGELLETEKGSFSIEWDSSAYSTWDLILIGVSEANAGDEGHAKTSWYAAAASDIDLMTPSCVIGLVMGESATDKLASSAERLFNSGSDLRSMFTAEAGATSS